MVKKDEPRRVSANNPEVTLPTNKGQQDVRKNLKDPGKKIPNPHRERQDRHGGGEGETGMQPGAGHPRGRSSLAALLDLDAGTIEPGKLAESCWSRAIRWTTSRMLTTSSRSSPTAAASPIEDLSSGKPRP